MSDDSCDGWPGDVAEAVWRTSSFTSGGECVAVAILGDDVAVRNSNNPEAGTLIFASRDFAALIAGVKAGQFDDLSA